MFRSVLPNVFRSISIDLAQHVIQRSDGNRYRHCPQTVTVVEGGKEDGPPKDVASDAHIGFVTFVSPFMYLTKRKEVKKEEKRCMDLFLEEGFQGNESDPT